MTESISHNSPLAPPLPGIDEAWARLSPELVAARGWDFVCRYYGYDNTGKNLTPAEANQIAAAGLWIVTVFEFNPEAPLQGHAQGALDGALYRRQANACNQPPGSTAYFACDADFTRDQYPVIAEYFKGAATYTDADGYRIGAYCGYYLGKWLLDNGLIDDLWQTYAWSNGLWDPRAKIRQVQNGVNVGGADVDLDTATVAFYGQWRPGMRYTDNGGSPMELNTTVPGTQTPDHTDPRTLHELIADEAQLRNMLVVGDVKPKVGSPLASLLAMPDQLASLLGQVQGISATLSNVAALLQSPTRGNASDVAVGQLAAAIEHLAAVAESTGRAAITPPAMTATADAGTPA